MLWLKSEYIVVPLKNLDAQKFYNCQFWAPSFLILAKNLSVGKNWEIFLLLYYFKFFLYLCIWTTCV